MDLLVTIGQFILGYIAVMLVLFMLLFIIVAGIVLKSFNKDNKEK